MSENLEIEKAPEKTVEDRHMMRCFQCKGLNLVRSGREVYRYECTDCGQHFIAVMQLVPVDAPAPAPILENLLAERRPGTR